MHSISELRIVLSVTPEATVPRQTPGCRPYARSRTTENDKAVVYRKGSASIDVDTRPAWQRTAVSSKERRWTPTRGENRSRHRQPSARSALGTTTSHRALGFTQRLCRCSGVGSRGDALATLITSHGRQAFKHRSLCGDRHVAGAVVSLLSRSVGLRPLGTGGDHECRYWSPTGL